jgi:hypothetical protein
MIRHVDEAVVQMIVLSLWLGAAALFVSSVAPAAFAVMPTRALAGAIVGRVLPSLFYAGMVVGVAVIALDLIAGRPVASPRSIAAAFMLASCAVAQFIIGARIERLRTAIGGSLESLPIDDVRRVTFGRLHGASVGMLGLAMLVAAVALVSSMRSVQPRT